MLQWAEERQTERTWWRELFVSRTNPKEDKAWNDRHDN